MHGLAAAATAADARVPRLPVLGSQVGHSATAPLNVLPPSEKAWPRVEVARRHVVETEAPHAQKVPITLRQRHAVIFSQAQQCATSTLRRKLSGLENSSDDEDAPMMDTKRQPSRRMSGDRRFSIERRSRESHSAYDRQRKQQQQQGGFNGMGSGNTISPRTLVSAAASLTVLYGDGKGRSGSSGGEADAAGSYNSGPGDKPRSGGSEACGAAEADLGLHARKRSTREGSRRSSSGGEELDVGLLIRHPEAPEPLEAGGLLGQAWQPPPAATGGACGPRRDEREWGPGQEGGGYMPFTQSQDSAGGEGAASQLAWAGQEGRLEPLQQAQQPSRAQQQQQPAASSHHAPPTRPRPALQPSSSAKLPGAEAQPEQPQGSRAGEPQEGHNGAAMGSHGRRAYEMEGNRGRSSLVEEALALPPSVMLGYETLDPFSMATLLSYASQQTGASQDSILPKPGW